MKKRKNNKLFRNIFLVSFIIIILIVIIYLLIGGYNKNQISKNSQLHAQGDISSYPYEEISTGEIEALNSAINDEYKARATYKRVIEELGDVKPFSNIIKAEESHISQLKSIYIRYNLEIPQDSWYDKVSMFNNLKDACSAGVNAEIENADLYDTLFIKIDNQDINGVFVSLRDASRNNHLPAFQRCSGN